MPGVDAYANVIKKHVGWLGGDNATTELAATRKGDGAVFVIVVGAEVNPVVEAEGGVFINGAGRMIMGVIDSDKATPVGSIPAAKDVYNFLGVWWKVTAVSRDSVRGALTASWRVTLEALEGQPR